MAISRQVWVSQSNGASRALSVPDEVPVEFRYNDTAYATMMASPDDLVDFATGFTLTEAIAADRAHIGQIDVKTQGAGFVVHVALKGADFAALLRQNIRTVPGRSSCGICGVRTLGDAQHDLGEAADGPAIGQHAISAAVKVLDTAHGLHGAAFCDPFGKIMLSRQDVGRHNALDKLIGAMARSGTKPNAGFCLLTSRCSYEMVQKAVRGGFSTLVAASSPTGLALDVAQQAGLTVIALASEEGHTVFVDGQAQDVAV